MCKAILNITLLLFSVFFVNSCGMGIGISKDTPTITSASSTPNADGSVTVTIYGTGFTNGTTVIVDGVACTNVTVISSTQLTCRLPNGSIALVNIVVTSPSSGSSNPNITSHTLFVTSATQNANFGGLSGADTYCRTRAAAGSQTSALPGTWRAILSTSTVNAKARFTLASGAPIKNTQGETIATSASDLWDGNLATEIRYDENGISTGAGRTWTGTRSDGTVWDTFTCSDWTSVAGTGIVGRQDQDISDWIDRSSANCSTSYSLYCINSNE